MPTLAGLDGGSLLPDFMGSVEKGMDFRKKVDQRRLVPDLVKRAREGDQEAINQLVTLDPDTLRNAFTLPGLGDTTRATQETAKLKTLQAQAGQERVRLLKINANLGAALAGGPENLRVNLAKMAQGRISEDDPDFNLDEVAEMMQMATTDPEKAFARLQEESTNIGSQLSTIDQILGAGQEGGFTLGEGQQRFDAAGNLVASGSNKAPPFTEIEKLINARASAEAAGDSRRVQILDNAISKATTASKGINVNIGGEPAFKVPSGFMLKDATNPALGVTPIPGGPKDKESGESAGKIQMLRTAEAALEGASNLVFNEDGSPNWKNIAMAGSNVPKTEGRELRNQMEFGIQAITRLETGAAMPESEVNNTRERFQPSVFDSPETIKLKMEMFNDFITGTIKLFDPAGRLDDDRFIEELIKRKGESAAPNVNDLVNKYAD
jgi:hypothetical protein